MKISVHNLVILEYVTGTGFHSAYNKKKLVKKMVQGRGNGVKMLEEDEEGVQV